MPSRPIRRTFPTRPQRRRLEWATTSFTDNAIASGTITTHDLLANFVADGGSREGITVIRAHAQLAYAPNGVGASARIGMIVTEMAAVGNQLDPVVNPYQSWMLDKLLFPGASGATVNATNVFELDLKSKRKVQHVQETLWFTWKPADTGTSSLNALFRVLVALP